MANLGYMLLLLAIALPALVYGQGRAEYGQQCNDDIRCLSDDIFDPLQCSSNGICTCEEDMFRHRTLNRCVSPDNAACTVRTGDGLPLRTCTEFAQCFPTGEPDPVRQNGTCVCDRDSRPDIISGECKLTHGSSRCRVETDCDVMSWVVCRESRCVCQDEAFQRHDEVDQKCKALVGGSCAAQAQPPFTHPECMGPRMHCDNNETRTCICDFGSSPNPDRTCGRSYDETCDPMASPGECHVHLVCDEATGKCGCQEGHAYQNGKCVILAGGNCSGSSELACTEHAVCQEDVCTCSPGFERGDDNLCRGLYGAPCNNDTSPCSTDDFLVCSGDQICTCQEKYEGDDETKLCKGYLGQHCREGRDEDCIGNSVCKPNEESGSTTCACPDRYEATGEKDCVGKYGVACENNAGCSAVRYLECNAATNRCECKDPEKRLYEGGQRDTCVSGVPHWCLDSWEGYECVTNATCLTTSPHRYCWCNPGHRQDEEGRCVPAQTIHLDDLSPPSL